MANLFRCGSNQNSNLGSDGQCLLSFLLSSPIGGSGYRWKSVYCNNNFATYGTNNITITKACKISKYSYAFAKVDRSAVIYVNGNPVITISSSGLGDNIACDISLNTGDVITSVTSLGSSNSHFSISLVLE